MDPAVGRTAGAIYPPYLIRHALWVPDTEQQGMIGWGVADPQTHESVLFYPSSDDSHPHPFPCCGRGIEQTKRLWTPVVIGKAWGAEK